MRVSFTSVDETTYRKKRYNMKHSPMVSAKPDVHNTVVSKNWLYSLLQGNSFEIGRKVLSSANHSMNNIPNAAAFYIAYENFEGKKGIIYKRCLFARVFRECSHKVYFKIVEQSVFF